MSNPYALSRPRLKQEIVARVAAGASLRQVCSAPGFPTCASVWNWGRADPGFQGELAQAKRVGDWRRRMSFDEAKAAAFLARLCAGERLDALLSDPAMPSRRTYRYWLAMQPPFAEAVGHVMDVRRATAVRRLRDKARRRWTFDQAVADQVYLAVLRGAEIRSLKRTRPELPCREIIARWRRENADFDLMMRHAIRMGRRHTPARARPRLTRQRTQAIVDHILTGGSLASYARRRGAPCRNTLYEWMQRDAAFAAQVAEACEHREDWYLEQQFEAERRALATATSMRAVRKAGAPYARQMARLKNRPGRGTAARWPRPLP